MLKLLFKLRNPVRFCINIFLCFSFLASLSQEIMVKDRYDELYGAKPGFYLSIRNDLNLEDYCLGMELGLMTKQRNLIFFGAIDARPYRKKVLEYQGNNLFYQYAQERYFAGVGVEYLRDFHDSRMGAFIQANGSYTWGANGGTNEKPPKGWVLVPRVGLYMKVLEMGYFHFGYSYMDAKTARLDKHRLFLAFGGILKKIE